MTNEILKDGEEQSGTGPAAISVTQLTRRLDHQVPI